MTHVRLSMQTIKDSGNAKVALMLGKQTLCTHPIRHALLVRRFVSVISRVTGGVGFTLAQGENLRQRLQHWVDRAGGGGA